MVLERFLLGASNRFGVLAAFERVMARNLAVLLYHRIADPASPNFYGFADNVSALPDNFRRQLDHVAARYKVLSLAECEGWITGELDPRRKCVMITFDDGYRDILTEAAPELTARGLPAVLFVSTGFIGGKIAFYWDLVADALQRTSRRVAELPFLGHQELGDRNQRSDLARVWIQRSKTVPEKTKQAAVRALLKELDVEGETPPDGTHLSWEELDTLRNAQIAIGAHTVTHPILAGISLEDAEKEISRSRARLEEQLGIAVKSFAFPNGRLAHDFAPSHEEQLREQGFSLAFAATGGTTSTEEARRRPFAIRRIGIRLADDMDRFAAKLAGVGRFGFE
jgi:peptidoglycan/xylan/chitin deacetylase (PgdA/CDA1 family)